MVGGLVALVALVVVMRLEATGAMVERGTMTSRAVVAAMTTAVTAKAKVKKTMKTMMMEMMMMVMGIALPIVMRLVGVKMKRFV